MSVDAVSAVVQLASAAVVATTSAPELRPPSHGKRTDRKRTR